MFGNEQYKWEQQDLDIKIILILLTGLYACLYFLKGYFVYKTHFITLFNTGFKVALLSQLKSTSLLMHFI